MGNRKHVMVAAAAAAGIALAGPALGQAQFATPGFYAGGGVGSNDDSEWLLRLFGGYQLHRNIAVELGYTNIGDVTIASQPAKAEAWEVAALGIIPLSELFSIYTKLGAYRGEAKGDGRKEKHNDLLFGVGGQFDLAPNVGLRLEWQRYTDFGGGGFGGASDLDVVSLNALWRFR
jgi:OOP family OmpA-OmpF porin